MSSYSLVRWHQQVDQLPFFSVKGIAKLKIEETNQVFEVSPDDLKWSKGNPNKQMERENYYSATISFYRQNDHHCVSAIWHFWEYPATIITSRGCEVNGCKLLQDFEEGVVWRPEEDLFDVDDW